MEKELIDEIVEVLNSKHAPTTIKEIRQTAENVNSFQETLTSWVDGDHSNDKLPPEQIAIVDEIISRLNDGTRACLLIAASHMVLTQLYGITHIASNTIKNNLNERGSYG